MQVFRTSSATSEAGIAGTRSSDPDEGTDARGRLREEDLHLISDPTTEGGLAFEDDLGFLHVVALHKGHPELEEYCHGIGIFHTLRDGIDSFRVGSSH